MGIPPLAEIKNTKDFWEVINFEKNPNYSEGIDKTIEAPSKFPYLCPVTKVEMNGISGKFVFGIKSKSLVGEFRKLLIFAKQICKRMVFRFTRIEKNFQNSPFLSEFSEKALRECNMGIFPKSASVLGKDSINKQASEMLEPCYNSIYEEKLMCPMTSKPFGRPILLYPALKLEIDRAKSFVHKKRKHSDKVNKENAPDQKMSKLVSP